jgi:hypothetical protein
MPDLTLHMNALTEELLRTTQADTIDRVEMRTRMIFEMFYDDEEGEPGQVIQDVLTDLMHVAAERGVDMEEVVRRAVKMFADEREEWELNE